MYTYMYVHVHVHVHVHVNAYVKLSIRMPRMANVTHSVSAFFMIYSGLALGPAGSYMPPDLGRPLQ